MPVREVSEPARPAVPVLQREVVALALGLIAALLALALYSFDPGADENLAGTLGAALSDVLVQALGLAAFLLPAALVVGAVGVLIGRISSWSTPRTLAGLGAIVASAILAQLAFGEWRGLAAGGIIGGFLRAVLSGAVGEAGAWLVGAAAAAVLAAFAAGQTLTGAGAALSSGVLALFRRSPSSPEDESADEPFVLGAKHIVGSGNLRRPAPERRPPVVVERKETKVEEESVVSRSRRQTELPFGDGPYCLPGLSLLDAPDGTATPLDREALIANSRVLETKLATFDVRGEVRNIHPGPVITTYEFEPAPGIKVQRVVALADDLAMAMRAMSVRILAPIPGKSVVGIEVSNLRREKVLLREIIAADAFQQSTSVLTLALGKDTTGHPVAGDLARMPHLLVAGATGAGKSVFLNALLASVLMRATPRDVRLVLVDPKMLELAPYEQIPHLLVPVITDARPAVTVLNNLVKEMNERYRRMRAKGVRNIDGYNRALLEEAEGDGPIALELEPTDGEERGAEAGPVHEHLPRIVVVIDELADLMMTRRDSEVPITMLAQKARAAGIHLVIATQRPSVDVITGLIKANFPARISFKVAGKVDSRTILDSMGADRLLGEGDMLFLPPGTSHLQRLHGAYVSDEEVQRIADFVRGQGLQAYRMDLLEDEDADSDDDRGGEAGDEPLDEMYDAAVRVVTESGKGSISYVQRRLQVGYNRAARMIEQMEREGVVSAADHRGVREVLARDLED
jgi:S-DNA-T family DNA segregation ATPase FtsK/SpoIIIE